MEPFKTLESRTVVLALDNVDTDQIIPARFLTVTTRSGMGKNLFADWRLNPDFVLNQPASAGASILVAGENFGCGSSREHAPWALVDYGFRAVVSTSIADIFKNNAVKNGLLPIEVDVKTHRELVGSPGASVVIDLEKKTLSLPDGRAVSFPLDRFAHHCLLDGIDQLDFLMQREDAIRAFEASSPAKRA
jgi:3-isopropylmalate/(R)-2-methylmalate dehydratase small subunit